MKVLLLVDEFPPNIWGGMGKSAFLLGQQLRKFGVNVVVITVNRSTKVIMADRINGLKVYRIPKINERKFINQYVMENKPDIIHVNGRHYAKCFEKNVQGLGFKFLYTSRSNFLEEVKAGSLRFNKEKLRHQEILLKISDWVVATSRNEYQSLLSYYPWLKKKLRVIHNGIDSKYDIPISPKNKLKIMNPYQIFFVGRFVKQKGIEIIVDIIPKIIKKYPKLVIKIAGGHGVMKYQKEILALEKKYKNLQFLGWLGRQELQKAYAETNIVLVPSNYEPFGLVTLEAMIKSCIVIANPVGGLEEIIKNKVNGYLVENNNSNEILKILFEIFSDYEKNGHIRENAFTTAQNSFTMNAVARRYIELYEKN